MMFEELSILGMSFLLMAQLNQEEVLQRVASSMTTETPNVQIWKKFNCHLKIELHKNIDEL